MRNKSKYKILGLLVLLLLACWSFARTTIEIMKSSHKLDASKQEIADLEAKKAELEKSIEYKKSEDYVEKTARNELNLIKPGETVFVVKSLKPEQTQEVDEKSGTITKNKKIIGTLTLDKRIENLQDWWNLFF